MRYHLYILFTMFIIGFVNDTYAAKTRNHSTSLPILQQDTLGASKRQEKRTAEKDKNETLAQTKEALKKVPKAKNKVIPRTIGPTSINVKAPRIKQVKVKVNTQVKIKL